MDMTEMRNIGSFPSVNAPLFEWNLYLQKWANKWRVTHYRDEYMSGGFDNGNGFNVCVRDPASEVAAAARVSSGSPRCT
ncbi:hypothetical protein Y032_0005g2753 [Ancylostoma ceylanicum]|uniref:Uncharacterized protein n=1 Tax=Ancylostoma ceylanicum TaxID=53326 RepID=A0A016VUC2_9BILA|nr:hypothetical protein Y032_0005g2753 [Ancylostoma ceylanicum]